MLPDDALRDEEREAADLRGFKHFAQLQHIPEHQQMLRRVTPEVLAGGHDDGGRFLFAFVVSTLVNRFQNFGGSL